MSVLASIVVQHGAGVDASSSKVVAELDDSLNINNLGEVKSSFNPGDRIYFLVHHDASVYIDTVAATHGSVISISEISLQREQQLSFGIADETRTLTYLPLGAITNDWKGRNGVGFTVENDLVSVGGGLPCLTISTYYAWFARYVLQTPAITLDADDTYPIDIYIYIEAVQ